MRTDLIADLAPTGALRAALNLGNPVLVQGTPSAPTGVTVDIAHEVAGRLGVPVEFRCFGAARESFQAAVAGQKPFAPTLCGTLRGLSGGFWIRVSSSILIAQMCSLTTRCF